MKLLLDQCLPRRTVHYLAKLGIPAEHVGDLGMATAMDEQILKTARDLHLVIVTFDSDFHSLLASTQARTPSVIRVRMEGLKSEQLADILVVVLTAVGKELETGAVVSVTADRIRVRRLPIGA